MSSATLCGSGADDIPALNEEMIEEFSHQHVSCIMEWRLRTMRITIAHTKSRLQMIQIVDRAFTDVFRGLVQGPITIANQQRSWQGSVLSFSLVAKMGMGLIQNPISGTVEVTDHDVTLDADLGILSKLMPPEKMQSAIATRLRGLLT